jgi:transglutaminase-like putative cysteine protease
MSSLAQTNDLNFAQASQRMAQIIVGSSRTKGIVAAARGYIRSLAPGDYVGEAQALARVVRDGIRYTGDPSGEDLYANPMDTLVQKAGDCNNKVLLFGSLARAIGFPVQMIFVFSDPNPDLQTEFPIHVLACVDVYKGERERAQWIPVELVPMPNATNGFPTVTVPFGTFRLPAGWSTEFVDVDQAAA